MISVAVIGARGYTGSALLPLIHHHPKFELVAVGSRSVAGRAVIDEVDGMEGCALAFTDITAETIGAVVADAFILAMPNGHAAGYVSGIEEHNAGSAIVDLSADYRFDADWVYGQPERFESTIRGARRISNPGCYATGAQLALAPLLKRLVSSPAVFGVSGYSGAGTKPSRSNDPEVLRDNLIPYSLVDHIHEKEAGRHLQRDIRLHPHVAPFFRGISLTVSAELDAPSSAIDLLEEFKKFYRGQPLVRVQSGTPEVSQVRHTHNVIIGGFAVSEQRPTNIAFVAVLDNLLKGAASQAVQNLNLAFDLEPLMGLES